MRIIRTGPMAWTVDFLAPPDPPALDVLRRMEVGADEDEPDLGDFED